MSRVIGCVKWFNKTGFGFITLDGSDIFVHHSNLTVNSDQYKYLVQGEYVEFVKADSTNPKHQYEARDVTGVHRGLLMCETRHKMKDDSRN